jgi:hypothetical protein
MVCPHCLCPTRRAGPRPSGLVTSCRDRRPKGLAAALPPSLICPHPHRGARWGRVLSGPAGTANHATRRLSALVRRGSQVPVWIVVLVAVLGRRPSLSLGHHPSSSRPGDCVAANYAIRARNCLFEFYRMVVTPSGESPAREGHAAGHERWSWRAAEPIGPVGDGRASVSIWRSAPCSGGGSTVQWHAR